MDIPGRTVVFHDEWGDSSFAVPERSTINAQYLVSLVQVIIRQDAEMHQTTSGFHDPHTQTLSQLFGLQGRQTECSRVNVSGELKDSY